MCLHWSWVHIEIQGPFFFWLLRILKKVQKRQLSVQEPFLRCPQQLPITVLGHQMPFSSLHIQVEHVHMCMHVQNENKPVKKRKKSLCLLLIFPFLHKHCAFFWTLKCWTHLQKWETDAQTYSVWHFFLRAELVSNLIAFQMFMLQGNPY